MRARKKNWAEKELNTNSLIIKNADIKKGMWKELFEDIKPIHVEIGCGMGAFITESAKRNPQINFVALEREEMVIVSGARAIREANEGGAEISNIRFICIDAKELSNIFEDGEVSRIYLNFSDPWPRKKKWAKRRLTHKNYLSLYKDILKAGGEIHMKTDNREMFEFSLNEFAQEGWRLRNISLDLHSSEFAQQNIVTEYERKFASRGFPIYRLEAFSPAGLV